MTTNPQDQTEQKLKKPEFQFEIFKLEYEQAVERYENIYKAIWQIFSYLTALTAAIVAFGANNLPLWAVVVIAPLPLLFWLLAIYIPMDFYGNQSRKRLADMEEGFNKNFLMDYPEIKLKHFSDFTQRGETPSNQSQQSETPSNQSQAKPLNNNLWQRLNDPWQTRWRVRQAISTFAGVAVLAWIFFLVVTCTHSSQLKPKFSRMEINLEPPVQVQTQEPQLQELNTELELLSKKLDSIESLLRTRNSATPNNNVGKPRQ